MFYVFSFPVYQDKKGENQPVGPPSAAEGGKKVRLNDCSLICRVFPMYYLIIQIDFFLKYMFGELV